MINEKCANPEDLQMMDMFLPPNPNIRAAWDRIRSMVDGRVSATPTGDPQPGPALEQSWAEIRDAMADGLLNQAQKKAFVISILKGQLANPPPAPRKGTDSQ